MDSDGNTIIDEFVASDLQLTKETAIWNENDYVKNHILNGLACVCMISTIIVRLLNKYGKLCKRNMILKKLKQRSMSLAVT